MRIDDFDDWPDDDKDKKFRRISKHQNKVHVQGFDAGLESGNLKGKGIFKKKNKVTYGHVSRSKKYDVYRLKK